MNFFHRKSKILKDWKTDLANAFSLVQICRVWETGEIDLFNAADKGYYQFSDADKNDKKCREHINVSTENKGTYGWEANMLCVEDQE